MTEEIANMACTYPLQPVTATLDYTTWIKDGDAASKSYMLNTDGIDKNARIGDAWGGKELCASCCPIGACTGTMVSKLPSGNTVYYAYCEWPK